MGGVDTDRILDGDDVSEAVQELHERQMVEALGGVINGIAQLQENLNDVVGTGDPARWVGIRRRAAGLEAGAGFAEARHAATAQRNGGAACTN